MLRGEQISGKRGLKEGGEQISGGLNGKRGFIDFPTVITTKVTVNWELGTHLSSERSCRGNLTIVSILSLQCRE